MLRDSLLSLVLAVAPESFLSLRYSSALTSARRCASWRRPCRLRISSAEKYGLRLKLRRVPLSLAASSSQLRSLLRCHAAAWAASCFSSPRPNALSSSTTAGLSMWSVAGTILYGFDDDGSRRP